MADPTKYTISYSFSGWQASNPAKPLPAQHVDDQFAGIQTSIGQLVDAVKDVRRSDGKLKNASVTIDSLADEVKVPWTGGAIAAWAPVVDYAAGIAATPVAPATVVFYNGETYLCATAHTTTALFETTKWTKLAAKGTSGVGAGDMAAANNLSDVADAAQARENIGAISASDLSASLAGYSTTVQVTALLEGYTPTTRAITSGAGVLINGGASATLGSTVTVSLDLSAKALAQAVWAAGVSLTPAPIDPATLAAVIAAKAPKPQGFSTLLRFGSSGSWKVPEGVTEIWVMLVGGGGGGGSSGGVAGTGGSGGIAIGRATVTPGQVIPYVIGAGANKAGAGGASTFLTLTATGGAGGSGGKGAAGGGSGDIVFGDYQRWNTGAEHPVRGLLDRLYPTQAIRIAVETAGLERFAATGSAATAWYPGYAYQAGAFGVSNAAANSYAGSVGGALWIFY